MDVITVFQLATEGIFTVRGAAFNIELVGGLLTFWIGVANQLTECIIGKGFPATIGVTDRRQAVFGIIAVMGGVTDRT